MRVVRMVSLILISLISSSALADQLQGLVRVTGNAPFKQVTITKPSEFVGTMLCPGDKAKRVMNLESLVVKVWGNPKEIGAVKCFDIGSFTALKTPAGNDAIVGNLQEKEGSVVLLAEDGRTVKLVDVPVGLRSMVGKKVVIDVKPQTNLTSSAFQAVYYAEFP
jgi:hypothetical protein